MEKGISERNRTTKLRVLGEKENYKYLGILETDTSKQVETKEKVRKEYLKKLGSFSKPSSVVEILLKGINIWAVSLVRYWDHS